MKKGMSLLEALLGILSFAIILDILLTMFLSGKAIWQSSATRTSDRQDLEVALRRISLDMRDSSMGSLTNNTGGTPSSFSFLSAYDASGHFVTDVTGAPRWQKYIVYYIPSGTSQLYRKEVFIGSILPTPLPGDPLGLPLLLFYSSGSSDLIAKSVESLLVTTGSGSKIAQVSLVLKATNLNGKTDEQAGQTAVIMQN